MKKVLLSLAVVAALGMTSCGGSESSADIKVEDIKDACGCADAVKVISGEMVAIAEKFDKDAEKLKADADAKKSIEDANKKLDEVMKHCRKELDVKESDLKKCDSFEAADKNMEVIKKM